MTTKYGKPARSVEMKCPMYTLLLIRRRGNIVAILSSHFAAIRISQPRRAIQQKIPITRGAMKIAFVHEVVVRPAS